MEFGPDEKLVFLEEDITSVQFTWDNVRKDE